MGSIASRFFRDIPGLEDPFGDVPLRTLGWAPLLSVPDKTPSLRMDVFEAEAAYTVKVELPGVRKEDIDVSIDGNMVTVDAHFEKGGEKEEAQKQIWTERSRGRMSRSFTLARAIDESRAEARFENGVLTLTLPKRTADESRRLTVT